MPNFISEEQIENALVRELKQRYRFDSINCYTERPEDLQDGSGRKSKHDVVLRERTTAAAIRLNPEIPPPVVDSAIERLLDRRLAMSPVAANLEIYSLLRDGVPVEFEDAKGRKQQD